MARRAPRPRAGRDLRLLTAGMAVSTAGDAAALTALSVALRSGGPGWVAALLGAQLVPVVALAAVAGRLVDRVETRRLLVVALTAQAALAVPLALAGPRWLIVTLFGALAAVTAVVRPATSAMVAAITGAGDVSDGYARVALGTSLGYIVGPAMGGLLVGAFGSRTALVTDALTFIVLAWACSRLSARREPQVRPRGPTSGVGDRAGGLRFVVHDAVLRVAVPVAAVAVACAVVDNVAAPFRFADQLRGGASGYGAYGALWGFGGLAASQLISRMPGRLLPSQRLPFERLLAAGNLLSGLGIAGIGLAGGLGVAFVAAVAGGVGNGAASIGLNALVAVRVPEAAHGRAFAMVGATFQAAVGLGTAAGAPLVGLLGAGGAMAGAGGVCSVLAAGHLALAIRRPSWWGDTGADS